MRKRKYIGRNALIIVSLALMLLSVWEICVRLDAMYAPIKMFFSMALGENIPLQTAMSYVDPSIFEAPAWLAGCILISLISIAFSSRRALCLLLLPISAVMAVYGLTREASFFVDFWRLVQPTLLMVICALSAFNLFALPSKRRKRKTSSPADAPRLTDAPRLKTISGGNSQKNSSRRAS